MGTIHAHLFSTLDGSVEDPSFTFPYGFDPQMGEELEAVTGPATAILLGRRTYEMFAPAWSQRSTEDDPGAAFFNETTKYVVSSTLADPDWGPVEVIAFDLDRIRQLRADNEQTYISGSVQLVRALLAEGLVDHLHLFVFPLAIGEGLRLFAEGERVELTLNASSTYANGVVHLDYGPAD